MICVVIKGPTYEEAQKQLSHALQYADLVELRLDFFKELDKEALKQLRSAFPIPMIFTLRSRSQGGQYAESEEKRLSDIKILAELKPEYLDLEHHISPLFIKGIASDFPEIKLILSYHNFTETPHDLENIYQEMRRIPATFYKIAVTAHHSLDALRVLSWVKQGEGNIIAISMGAAGQISRILGPLVGSPITFASLDDDQQSAPGQMTAKTLVERYHYRSLGPQTAVYALIGDPVDLSISDHTHNHLFHAYHLGAVYIKIQVKASELPKFLEWAKKLPFQGISVTMPLKEIISADLDHIDSQALKIGAVNTLLLQEGKWIGFNTDGIGALNAIEKELPVKGKRMIILGAGGAAKAIAFESHRRGGNVTILNRDPEKARQMAQHFHCQAGGLEQMRRCAEEGYDILVNCTPVSLPINPKEILPKALVMDIKTLPFKNPFLEEAMKKGCRVVHGYRMFVEQAIGQIMIWFGKQIPQQESGLILETEAKNEIEVRNNINI